MDNYNSNDYQYVAPAKPEPRGKAITAMVLGIVSIEVSGVVGIILAILARKFAAPILSEFEGTTSATFAKVANITGLVGLIFAIISCAISVVVLIVSTFMNIIILPFFTEFVEAFFHELFSVFM